MLNVWDIFEKEKKVYLLCCLHVEFNLLLKEAEIFRLDNVASWYKYGGNINLTHLTSHQQEVRRGEPSDEIGQILVRFLAAAPHHPPERFDCFLLGGNI